MKIIATINNETHIIHLYNFQYWNQRWFCLGLSLDGSIFKKFITTKGFDSILIESNSGIQFNFKQEHFSPYLCNKEKDIWKESQLIANNANIVINDIGPFSYSGKYKTIQTEECFPYKDDVYFETKAFETPDFDLLKYQNDDFYYSRYQSTNKDRLPLLVSLTDIELFNDINIIHGVRDDGVDLFDTESLYQICDTDLSFPEKNSLYLLYKSINQHFFHCVSIGNKDFVTYNEIKPLENDYGNTYIKRNIVKNTSKRKYALRYLYEYFHLVNKITTNRRKISTKISTGVKDFKKEDFIVHFNNDNASEFKIIYYKDIFSIEKRQSITNHVAGEAQFMITGIYDYTTGTKQYDNFTSDAHLIKTIRNQLGISQSIHLAKIISIWLISNYGYTPRMIKLQTSSKANSKAISNSISLFSVPTYDNNEFYGDSTYVNLYELFANFGLHIPQVRNILKMNEFSNALFQLIKYKFDIYHISRDYRRPLFKWEMDTELSNCMVDLKTAIKLIKLFESIGSPKNSYWYSNANQIIIAFPNMIDPEVYAKLDYPLFVEENNETNLC